MSLSRTMARRQRSLEAAGNAKVLRALLRQYVREHGLVERAGVSEAALVRTGMRLVKAGKLAPEIEDAGDGEHFRFDVRPRLPLENSP